jgi:hypothetical protein
MLFRTMLFRTLILTTVALSSVAGQTAPVAAKLVCPPANQTLQQDPAVFTWMGGSQTPNYRLLLGPAVGSSRDGDSSMITGLQGQLAGLPQGQNLFVTLWSYDQNGNAVEPPSSCPIKTAQQPAIVGFQDVPGTALAGVSLGSFAAAAGSSAQAVQSCQTQCKENAGCQGYTYYPAGPGNATAMCDLKSQITQSQPDECCLSGLKTVTRADAPNSAPTAASVGVAAPAPAPVSAPAPAPARASTQARVSAPAPVTATAPAPVRAPAPATAPSARGLTGDWVNQFGAISRIVQKGDTITGTYSDAKQPELSGTFQGTFDGKTLQATLKWKAGADSSSGSLLLTLTPQGRLEGTWTDAKGVSGPWNMGPAGSGAR